jgi:hypothetical protein
MAVSGGAWPPDELIHYEQTVATLSIRMSTAEFERMRSWGRSMTTPQGVEFALKTQSSG